MRQADRATEDKGSLLAAFVAVATLFLAWGFITSLIDPLVAAVKGVFTLSNLEAQLSAFAFFIAYGLFSFPAATLVTRLRPVPAILSALAMMACGCLVMLGAANLAVYPLVLAGLFVLACGITVLQVAANPLAAALGAPERSHLRLTLAQTFNSFGTFIGPLIGAGLFLAGVEVENGTSITPEVREAAFAGIDRAYFWICGLLLLLLAFFYSFRRTVSAAAPEPEQVGSLGQTIRDGLSSRWALLGGLAIFLYVGAEVAIGTQMALFLNGADIWRGSNAPFDVPFVGWVMASDGVPGVSLQEAARAVALYWGGAMVGRAIGTSLLAYADAARLLIIATVLATVLCLYVAVVGGVGAGFVALAIGLFNSVMFPIIFTLTLERSTASAQATSGMLCTAITGGAFIPLLVGMVADGAGHAAAFIVPGLCYAALVGFAVMARRTPPLRNAAARSAH